MPRYRRPANRVTERIVSEFPDFEGWTDEEKVAATTVSAHFQGVRFETVDNGWGGKTTRRVEPKPPTQETITYCKQLMDERNGYAQTERLRAWLNRAAKRRCLTQAMVDSAIKSLQEQRGTQ